MGYKKNRKTHSEESNTSVRPETISINAEELKQIITTAILEAEEKKESTVLGKRIQAHKEWQETIGYKEYMDKNPILRFIKTVFNRIKCLFKIEFIPASKIKGDRASISLIRLFSKLVLRMLQILMIVAGLGFVAEIFVLIEKGQYVDTMHIIWNMVICIVLLIMSGFFRMASIEVDSFEDRNYLVGLFAAITSIISIAVAIVAIVYQR